MRSLAFMRGLGDSAQRLLGLLGAVTSSHARMSLVQSSQATLLAKQTDGQLYTDQAQCLWLHLRQKL
jgi:hypothetical protein